jgi:hypothetical protein
MGARTEIADTFNVAIAARTEVARRAASVGSTIAEETADALEVATATRAEVARRTASVGSTIAEETADALRIRRATRAESAQCGDNDVNLLVGLFARVIGEILGSSIGSAALYSKNTCNRDG